MKKRSGPSGSGRTKRSRIPRLRRPAAERGTSRNSTRRKIKGAAESTSRTTLLIGAVSLVALATGVRYHRAARRALAEVAGAYFAVVRLALRFVRDPRAYGTWYRLVVCLASDPDPLRANLEFLLRVLDEKQAKRG